MCLHLGRFLYDYHIKLMWIFLSYRTIFNPHSYIPMNEKNKYIYIYIYIWQPFEVIYTCKPSRHMYLCIPLRPIMFMASYIAFKLSLLDNFRLSSAFKLSLLDGHHTQISHLFYSCITTSINATAGGMVCNARPEGHLGSLGKPSSRGFELNYTIFFFLMLN